MKHALFIGIIGTTLSMGGGIASAQSAKGPSSKSPGPKIKLKQKGPDKDKGQSFQFQMSMQSRGRLGARVIAISSDLRAYFGAPGDVGLLVDSVVVDSPADKAGMKAGDLIMQVEGSDISQIWDIRSALGDKKKGDKVSVQVLRNKKKKTLTATLDSEGSAGGIQGFGFGPGQGFRVDPFDGFGPNFPFGGSGAFGPSAEMLEQMKKLEERLERLEGRRGQQKAPSNKPKSGKKKLNKAPAKGKGNSI